MSGIKDITQLLASMEPTLNTQAFVLYQPITHAGTSRRAKPAGALLGNRRDYADFNS